MCVNKYVYLRVDPMQGEYVYIIIYIYAYAYGRDAERVYIHTHMKLLIYNITNSYIYIGTLPF